MKITGISGGLSSPSRTTALVERVLNRAVQEPLVTADLIRIADLGPALGAALSPSELPAVIDDAFRRLYAADAIVVGTPIYKGSYAGLLKHFFDLADPKALVGKVAVLLATGGSDNHALVLEHQLRPLLSFFGTVTVPTTLYVRDSELARDGSPSGYSLDSALHLERIELLVEQALRLGARQRPSAIAA